MDLLGRKTRKLLEQVVTHAERLEAGRDAFAQYSRSQEAYIADLSRRLFSRESLIGDLFAEIEELKERLERAQQPIVVSEPNPTPIHMSEEEQELEFQLRNKMIDKQEYETLLAELDFQNASIELDPDFSRPNLTY